MLVSGEEIIGSVACYGNEIDDLIVNQKFQNKGYGKQLWNEKMILIKQAVDNFLIQAGVPLEKVV